MSRTFSKNTSNYMSLGVATVNGVISGAPAISFHAWIWVNSLSSSAVGNNGIFKVFNSGTTVSGVQINVNATGTPVLRVGGRSRSGDGFAVKTGTTELTTGRWWSVGGVLNFTGDSITPYVDGAPEGGGAVVFGDNTYTPGTPTVNDMIGSSADPVTTLDQFDGLIAEPALWITDIGSNAFAALKAGAPAYFVDPANLALYWMLLGDASPEPELIQGANGTITGSLPKADHPPAMWSPRLIRRAPLSLPFPVRQLQ